MEDNLTVSDKINVINERISYLREKSEIIDIPGADEKIQALLLEKERLSSLNN